MPITPQDIRVTGALSGGGPGGADDDMDSDGGYLSIFFDAPVGSEDVEYTTDTLALQQLLTSVCNAAIEWLADPAHLADYASELGTTSVSTLDEVAAETADAADSVDRASDVDDDPFGDLF